MLDLLFEKKYELFQDIFEDCSPEFKRRVVRCFEFRMYLPDRHDPRKQNPSLLNPNKIDLPYIFEAFSYSTHIHFIQSGKVFIMDPKGLYQYAVLQKGSYFGDISILLGKPNVFSYMFNPFQTEKKPLMTFRVEKKLFLEIIKEFPYEHENWIERAKNRLVLFENYKSLSLLKMMKTILKDVNII